MARLADPELAERRRRQILEAAEACFIRRGFHQATMQEICAEANISPGALYRYFNSKADIIAAIAEDSRRDSEARLETVLDSGGLIDALTFMSQRFFGFVTEAEGAALMGDVIAEAARDPLLAQRLRAIDDGSVRRLSAAIAAAQRRGEVDPAIHPAQAAETVFALMEGIAMRYSVRRDAGAAGLIARFREAAARYLGAAP
jgi:AcrR family transcriptional regulator